VESVDRPWSRHRTYDWRTGRFEPPASKQAEDQL